MGIKVSTCNGKDSLICYHRSFPSLIFFGLVATGYQYGQVARVGWFGPFPILHSYLLKKTHVQELLSLAKRTLKETDQ